MDALKRFVLWDYARTTWQYDLIVGLILAGVFALVTIWFLGVGAWPRTAPA